MDSMTAVCKFAYIFMCLFRRFSQFVLFAFDFSKAECSTKMETYGSGGPIKQSKNTSIVLNVSSNNTIAITCRKSIDM